MDLCQLVSYIVEFKRGVKIDDIKEALMKVDTEGDAKEFIEAIDNGFIGIRDGGLIISDHIEFAFDAFVQIVLNTDLLDEFAKFVKAGRIELVDSDGSWGYVIKDGVAEYREGYLLSGHEQFIIKQMRKQDIIKRIAMEAAWLILKGGLS